MNNCKNELLLLNDTHKDNPTFQQAKQLYENATYYLTINELPGALVSYSCAAVLFNLLNTAETTSTNISRSSSESSINTVPNLSQASQETDATQLYANQPANSNNNNTLAIKSPQDPLSTILTCCLKAIENLQQKVSQMCSSNKKKDDDEEEKPWDKICTKIQPLVFKKGGSDCIFFQDVAGLFIEKKMMDESLIKPLQFPNVYPAASRGLLIYGPPGTGKTYLVKAAVNELQKKDPHVGILFFAPSPGDLKGKYVGETEKKIEEIFVCASKAACTYQNEICKSSQKKYRSIIFMDEMDAIAPDRNNDPTGLAVNSVNTLLQMMDGIKSKPNITVIAATNYPWNLDSAILRRFDSQIFIDVPTERDLLELLDIQMRAFINIHKNVSDMCINNNNNNKNSLVAGCQLECEPKVTENILGKPPYSKMKFTFFEEMKKQKDNEIKNIVTKMVLQNFSNSDLSTFMKTAQRKAGEFALRENLFYSTNLLGYIRNPGEEIYVSSLSAANDIDTQVNRSIEIINALLKNQAIHKDFYFIEIPDIIKIDFNGFVYYNRKCLLCKPDIILDDPYIKDVYIKGHPIREALNYDYYNENILGKVSKEGIDIIMTFDNITFFENKNIDNDKIQIFPKAMGILETVVTPLVNAYNNTKESYNKASKFNQKKASDTLKIYNGFDVKAKLFDITNDDKCSLYPQFNKLAEDVCIINNETFLKYRHNLNYLRWLHLKNCYQESKINIFESEYLKIYTGTIESKKESSNDCENISILRKDGGEQIDVCIDKEHIYIENVDYLSLIDIIGFQDNLDIGIENKDFTKINILDKITVTTSATAATKQNINKFLKIPFKLFYNLFNDLLIMPQKQEGDKNIDIIQIDSNSQNTSNIHKLIQMLIDDILNYKLIVGEEKQKEKINVLFNNLLKLDNIFEINIIKFIIQRAFDNYLLRNPTTIPPPASVPAPATTNSPTPSNKKSDDDNSSSNNDGYGYHDYYGGTALSKSKTKTKSRSKTISNSKKTAGNKTVKKYYVLPKNNDDNDINNNYGNVHFYGGNDMAHIIDETIELDGKNNIIYGGDDTPYEKFLEWTVKDNIPETTSKNIAKKTAYLHTTVNLDWRDLPEYTNLFSILYYSTLGYGTNTIKNVLEKLMKKNLLLATLFKRIDFIGFLVDKTNPNKTESDDLIIQRNKEDIIISWGNINTSTLIDNFKGILGILRGDLTSFLKGISNAVADTIDNALVQIGLIIGIVVRNFEEELVQIAFDNYDKIKNIPDYLYDFLISILNWFSRLLPNITMPTVLTNMGAFLLNLLNGGWSALLSGGGYIASLLGGGSIVFLILAFIIFINLVTWANKDNIDTTQIMNNVIVNQIYTMVRDIKVFEVDHLNINPCTLFGKILDKSQKTAMNILPNINQNFFKNKTESLYINVAKNNFLTIDMSPSRTTNYFLYQNIYIKSSTSKNSIVVNKEKLINVEIPLTAFYYALLNTRSTYPKELAGDLKEYNQNKDAFMLKLKKKREKNT